MYKQYIYIHLYSLNNNILHFYGQNIIIYIKTFFVIYSNIYIIYLYYKKTKLKIIIKKQHNSTILTNKQNIYLYSLCGNFNRN